MKPGDFTVGQTVFIAERKWNGRPQTADDLTERRVMSIGRKWVNLNFGRFDPERMLVDRGPDFTNTDSVYVSREAYTQEQLQAGIWLAFKRLADKQYSMPPASSDDMRAAARILGFDLDAEVERLAKEKAARSGSR